MNNVKHKCTYAICEDCFRKKHEKGNKKRKRNLLINDTSDCDHTHLDFFVESDYFSPDFIEMRKDRGDIFPTKCADCKRIFTNVKSTGIV